MSDLVGQYNAASVEHRSQLDRIEDQMIGGATEPSVLTILTAMITLGRIQCDILDELANLHRGNTP